MDQVNSPLHGYLRIVFRRKWLLIMPAFICFVLAIALAVFLPRQYLASTKILVQEGKTDNPLFNNIAMSSSMMQRTQAIRETILGWDNLVKLIKRLNLDKDVKSNADYEKLIATLRTDIIIHLRDGNIIDLTYVSDSAQEAKDVVQNVTDIFIERNMDVQNKETQEAIKFIEEQLRVYKGKIKSTEIAELQDKLNDLLVDSTEQHPLVIQLRDQIKKKMDELKTENLEFSQEARLNADTANPIISQIKKNLDSFGEYAVDAQTEAAAKEGEDPKNANKDIYKLMLLERLDNVMARDVDVNNEIYNSLLRRLETAKITQRLQASKEGTRYTILDPPRVPIRPIKPNIIMVIILGLMGGLGLGVSLIFCAEFLDKSFLDVQDASSFLRVPLLGAISKINTQESIKADLDRERWLTFWMISSGILFICCVVFIKIIVRS